MLWECSKKACSPCAMCVVSFLFITSRDTGTGMLLNSALTSKETVVSSGLIIFPWRHSASPSLPLTKEKFLPVYFCKILVSNFDSL